MPNTGHLSPWNTWPVFTEECPTTDISSRILIRTRLKWIESFQFGVSFLKRVPALESLGVCTVFLFRRQKQRCISCQTYSLPLLTVCRAGASVPGNQLGFEPRISEKCQWPSSIREAAKLAMDFESWDFSLALLLMLSDKFCLSDLILGRRPEGGHINRSSDLMFS